MPSLTPKLIGGHTYYYARYCQRVNGKPKIVRQVYLGKLDDLVAVVEQSRLPPQPLETEVASFGDIAALFDIAQRLDLVQLLIPSFPTNATRAFPSASICSWPPSTAPSHPPANCNLPTGTGKPP